VKDNHQNDIKQNGNQQNDIKQNGNHQNDIKQNGNHQNDIKQNGVSELGAMVFIVSGLFKHFSTGRSSAK
jgi:hypothetical protein